MKKIIPFILYIGLASLFTAYFTVNPNISTQEKVNWWILHVAYHTISTFVLWIMSQINTEDLKLHWRYIVAGITLLLVGSAHATVQLTGHQSMPYADWIAIPSIGSYIFVAMITTTVIGCIGAVFIAIQMGASRID